MNGCMDQEVRMRHPVWTARSAHYRALYQLWRWRRRRERASLDELVGALRATVLGPGAPTLGGGSADVDDILARIRVEMGSALVVPPGVEAL